jgi:hypothetical protein
MSLSTSLKDESKRPPIIDDCVDLVDAEVQKKGGLGGVVIKTGYKAVKGIKPGFIRQVVDSLLDRWASELDPIWDDAKASGKGVRVYFDQERARVAEALLKVTDDKAKSSSGLVASTYSKLRPTAKKHVEEAVPGLATVLTKHID